MAAGRCLTDTNLCDKVLAVDHDTEGHAVEVVFLSEIEPGEEALEAERALACLVARLPELRSSCTRSAPTYYKQSCTLH
jgi:hypothetical protein